MENIISVKHKTPKIANDAYINPYAVVIGEVEIHSGASLWPGVIVRADDERIVIGKNSALLDRVLIEAPHGSPVELGQNVLVSHNVTLHGCIIDDGVLIGIGANVLDGSYVGAESVIGASALVPSNMRIPPKSKVLGVPGKITGEVSEQELEDIKQKHEKIMLKAKDYGTWFVAGQI